MVSPPWIFNAFWKVIRPLLDPVTRDKIVFVKDKKKNASIVKEHIHEHDLESDFGGSSEWVYNHEEWKIEIQNS